MTTAQKFAVIRQSVVLEASPEEVFEAYVDPKKHEAFTGSTATGSKKVGGKFTAWDGYITGRYVELEGGKRILHEWKTTGWPEGYPPSVVEITFSRKGKRTKLSMVHSKVPEEQVDEYAQGWKDFYWEPLKKYFEKS
ncbi:MAG: SRPBCC domain-containing protein [Thaumarchaeota archaeon]|nr:SRPBCC domain-containing protein [Nitrososphaerota archaeon]